MLTSLGFDTLVVRADKLPSNVEQALTFFYELGIKNILILFDYDPIYDSIAIIKSKAKEFKARYSEIAYRKIKIKCALNLHVSEGVTFNDSINRIYCNKQTKSLFVTLPLFPDVNYNSIALDVNNLLYKKKALPIFTSFEKSIESSNLDFCSKFINNPKINVSIDINYLLNPQKEKAFKKLISGNCMLLPEINRDISNYAGITAATEFIIQAYGKKAYYSLCSQINKASTKLIFNS